MFNYNLKMIMKKVSLLLCLFVALSTISLSAQEGAGNKPGRTATFESNGFWDNWFIGLGASASAYFGSNWDGKADFFDRLTVNPNAMVGKWFNPYMGLRLQAQGGKIHTFLGQDAEAMYSQTHLNLHGDFMWNWTNYLCKYDKDRFYNFIMTAGFGMDRRKANYEGFLAEGWNGRAFNGITINASLLNTFRINDRLSAFVEVGGFIVEKGFDKRPRTGHKYNGIGNASAGLMVTLGKPDWNEAVLMDQGLIDDLNSQINRLRAENSQLSKRPVSCPECPPVTAPAPAPSGDVVVPNVVFFRLNSANIDRNQEINIYNTAEYLKNNPNAKVKIVGYADRQTGTADYNMKLSEKRAKNVAKVLIEKYNINSSRVNVEWKGSSEQPYKENAWNRVAIFFAE